MTTSSRCPHCYEDMPATAGSCDRCRTEQVYQGFTRAELSDAFDLVKHPDNWKLPIDTVICSPLSPRQIEAIKAAVIFYAGCRATVSRSRSRTIIKAAGYYRAVGA